MHDWGIVFAAVIGFGLLVIIPMIAIMTEHQRKMAKIVRGQADSESTDRDQLIIGLHANVGNGIVKKSPALAELTNEIRELRSEVASLRMELASSQGRTLPPMPEDSVRTHLSQGV